MPHERPILSLVLHAHLPFVRHPEHEDFLEERWLFEAIAEVYVPLLDVLAGLVRDRVPHRIALSLSPTLLDMLDDGLLGQRFVRHLDLRLAFADRELVRTAGDERLRRVVELHRELLLRARTCFVDENDGRLVPAFRRLEEAGSLELLTCGATHGFLPLLAATPGAVEAQVAVAVAEFRRSFGHAPRGFWLPECGFTPGLDDVLARHGILWSVVESHGLLDADPPPVHGTFAPVVAPSGVAFYGRDGESSREVWSATEGYPGDPAYRDFHRDVGFELPVEDLRPLLPPTGDRVAVGFKYFRVTGAGAEKEPYDPDAAASRVEQHASHFVAAIGRRLAAASALMRRPPVLVAPYDAELFGHWWFEGPAWLDAVLRRVADSSAGFDLATPSDDLARHPVVQQAMPAASSWGERGYASVWVAPGNDWILRHVDGAGERMRAIATGMRGATGLARRALAQAARELLLAQARDWPFLISRGTAAGYAEARVRAHLGRFARLHDDLRHGTLDEAWLAEIERRDDVFPVIDPGVFADEIDSPRG
ncbi:MAG: glycoside hydrolase family 57 protein [Alphaproteobacteria bacterium]